MQFHWRIVNLKKMAMSTKKEAAAKYYQQNKLRISERDRNKCLLDRLGKLCRVCEKPCLDLRLKKYCSYDCYHKGRGTYDRKWKRDHAKDGWFYKYKSSLGGCARCGYNKCLAALDFHHVNPKLKLKSPASVKNCSETTGLQELAKCELVCANCHREETYLGRMRTIEENKICRTYSGKLPPSHTNTKLKPNGDLY